MKTRYHLFSEEELAQAINTWARDTKEEADQQAEENAQVAIDTGAFGTAAAPLLLDSMAAQRKAQLRNQHAINAVAKVEERANEDLHRVVSGSNAVIEAGEFLARINAYCDEVFTSTTLPIENFWDHYHCCLVFLGNVFLGNSSDSVRAFARAAGLAGVNEFIYRRFGDFIGLRPDGYPRVVITFSRDAFNDWASVFPNTIPEGKEPA